MLYCPAAYFIKATLLLLTARVFAVYERVARAIKWFVVMLAVAYIPIQFVKMFVCIPVESFWNRSIKPTRCLSQPKAFIFDRQYKSSPLTVTYPLCFRVFQSVSL